MKAISFAIVLLAGTVLIQGGNSDIQVFGLLLAVTGLLGWIVHLRKPD